MVHAVQGLSPSERKTKARELLNKDLSTTHAVQTPTAVFTGGQPGSGKSITRKHVVAEYDHSGGIIEIDPDQIRLDFDYMRPMIAAGGQDIPGFAYSDAGRVAFHMVGYAAEAKRNALIDGTLKNIDHTLQLIGKLRAAGYKIEIHGMAVYPGLSHARTYARREEEIANSPSGFGRGVDDDYHHEAVHGYMHTIELLYTK